MRRRALLLGAVAALVAPNVTGAQPAKKTYRIGWLSPESAANGKPNLDALRQGLGELGYVEKRNLVIETRWAEDDTQRLPALAAELVRLNVDLICTAGTPATAAAKGATTKIPIVFASAAFPDETGLVASYARPGANATGVAFVGPEYGKRLELLKEIRPGIARVALIYNPENKASVRALRETERWAKSLTVALEPRAFHPQARESLFGAIATKLPDALMTTADPVILSHRKPIVDFANKHRLLAMYPLREFVDEGGLVFYGASVPEMYRRAAVYIDRILKGAAPQNLPVEEPVKFDMVINARVAKTLGITIPKSVLLRADRVIE